MKHERLLNVEMTELDAGFKVRYTWSEGPIDIGECRAYSTYAEAVADIAAFLNDEWE